MALLVHALAAALAAEAVLPPAEPPPSAPEVIQTRSDSDRRMKVPVRIGENGPFHFIIDTGSQTTVIGSSVARSLALAPGRRVRVVGLAGAENIDTVLVEEVGLGRRSYYGLTAPVLEDRHIGAEGIVGIDGLQQQRVLLDFVRNQLTVGDARSLGGNGRFEIVVIARRKAGQLIMTDAVIDGVRTNVIIDTGAEASVGNRALQRALSHRGGFQQVRLTSATGAEIVADLGFPKKLTIDSFAITNLMVAYADSPVFDVLELTDRPAMFLGMRELRLFRRVAIDFRTRRVYFDLPDGMRNNRRD